MHGHGVSFEDAATVFPTYFGNLADNPPGAGYDGVLIGFDWPSDYLEGHCLSDPSDYQGDQRCRPGLNLGHLPLDG